MLMTEGMRLLERSTRQPAANPLAGLRTALLAGACLLGAVVTLVTHGPVWLWIVLFTLAVVFAMRK
jgi:ubiquinone biosynthesis protein